MNRHIIYHDPCLDGWGAAFIAAQYFQRYFPSDKITLVPAKYGDPIPESITRSDEVYIVDFSYPPGVMVELANKARNVEWIDHHKTAIEAWHNYTNTAEFGTLPGNLSSFLSLYKSGVGLVWEYFFPTTSMPAWAAAVQDRDLWEFKQPHTKAICAYLATLPKDIDSWEKVERSEFEYVVELGEAILLSHNKIVQDICNEGAIRISICGQEGLAANCTGQYASDVGHELCKRSGRFGATWFQAGDGRIKFSLRSEDDKIDVSELAKKYGGGGHRNAAGFTLPNVNCLGMSASGKLLICPDEFSND